MGVFACKIVMRIQKPFRMISLRKIRQQLPWIDILTKNTRGWGCIPFSNPPIPANAAAPGAKGENGAYLADLPTIFEVLERLGLKMEPEKANVDVYVIDHIERPSEN